MFTAEIKINGQLVTLVYGRNMGIKDLGDEIVSYYKADVYMPEKGMEEVDLHHNRKDGINKLVANILEKAGSDEL
jgi:hypothetical protein